VKRIFLSIGAIIAFVAFSVVCLIFFLFDNNLAYAIKLNLYLDIAFAIGAIPIGLLIIRLLRRNPNYCAWGISIEENEMRFLHGNKYTVIKDIINITRYRDALTGEGYRIQMQNAEDLLIKFDLVTEKDIAEIKKYSNLKNVIKENKTRILAEMEKYRYRGLRQDLEA
jgi:hypothetical protein